MAVYVNKNKWRGVKIGGKTVTKIYKAGEKIYDAALPLKKPVIGDILVNLSGAVNTDFLVPHSGWYRFNIAANSGGNGGNGNGGGGAIITYDLFLEKNWRVIIWSATRVSGAPSILKGGNGSGQNWYSSSGGAGRLGGGGAAGGYTSGGGGGGAAGDGGNVSNAGPGGGGSGAIVYKGNEGDYADKTNWLYLILCGGGGGGCGYNGDYRAGGGGGGGGSNGGGTNWNSGGAGDYNGVTGIQRPGNGGAYSNGAVGSGNVIDVRDAANPKVLSNRTGAGAAWAGGYAQIYPLY